MQRRFRKAGWTIGIIAIVGASVAFWLRPTNAQPSPPAESAPPRTTTGPRVVVVQPQAGGQSRRSVLQCEAHWFESAELFAKVSGYLKSQNVDLGSRVKAGDILAVVDMPELEHDVELMAATRAQALAEVRQAQAREKTAEAEHRAAQAAELRSKADVERWEAERSYREKEHARINQLSQSGSVQASIVDEKLFQLQAVEAGTRSAEGAVRAAAEQTLAAAAEIDLAQANSQVAAAKAKVAEAQHSRAEVMAAYAKIAAPFDGAVTARGFHRGDFVLAADRGGDLPLFQVARTDLIRVVVRIPDRQVPFAQPGDKAEIEFDAFPGRIFTGRLARIGLSEDPQTRTMRAEVDLPNTDGLIVDQMYGRMTIDLESASEGVRVPSTCLVGDVRDGSGKLFVVTDGVARLQTVAVGPDDGSLVEIKSGLEPSDEVVLRAPPGLTDGSKVVAVTADGNAKAP